MCIRRSIVLAGNAQVHPLDPMESIRKGFRKDRQASTQWAVKREPGDRKGVVGEGESNEKARESQYKYKRIKGDRRKEGEERARQGFVLLCL